jgi:hypothetical protein
LCAGHGTLELWESPVPGCGLEFIGTLADVDDILQDSLVAEFTWDLAVSAFAYELEDHV